MSEDELDVYGLVAQGVVDIGDKTGMILRRAGAKTFGIIMQTNGRLSFVYYQTLVCHYMRSIQKVHG